MSADSCLNKPLQDDENYEAFLEAVRNGDLSEIENRSKIANFNYNYRGF